MFLSGAMDRRSLATAMFVKDVDDLFDSFSGVADKREHWKVLRCCLSSTSEHLEYWRNAFNRVKNWTFLNKKSERILPPPAQTGWLITIGAVQHVWRRVRKEKFKHLETRYLNQDALQSINQFILFSRNPIARLLPHGYGNSQKYNTDPSNMIKNNEQYYIQE